MLKMKIKPTGRKMVEEKLVKLEKYGHSWTHDYLKSSLEYYMSTFIVKYLES